MVEKAVRLTGDQLPLIVVAIACTLVLSMFFHKLIPDAPPLNRQELAFVATVFYVAALFVRSLFRHLRKPKVKK